MEEEDTWSQQMTITHGLWGNTPDVAGWAMVLDGEIMVPRTKGEQADVTAATSTRWRWFKRGRGAGACRASWTILF